MIKKVIVGLAATALTAGAIAYATMVPSGLEHKNYEGMIDGQKVKYSVGDWGSDLPLQDVCRLNVYEILTDKRNKRLFMVTDIGCDNTADSVNIYNGHGQLNENYTREEMIYGQKAAKYDGRLKKVQDKFTNPQHDADAKHQRMMKNL